MSAGELPSDELSPSAELSVSSSGCGAGLISEEEGSAGPAGALIHSRAAKAAMPASAATAQKIAAQNPGPKPGDRFVILYLPSFRGQGAFVSILSHPGRSRQWKGLAAARVGAAHRREKSSGAGRLSSSRADSMMNRGRCLTSV